MKLVLSFAVLLATGCGVKGDPQPPHTPPQIGRGQPTFKDAVKGVETTPVPTRSDEDEDEQN